MANPTSQPEQWSPLPPQRVPVPSDYGALSLNLFYNNKQPSWCVSNCRSIEVAVIYPSSHSHSSSTPGMESEHEITTLEIYNRNQNPTTRNPNPDLEPADMDLERPDLVGAAGNISPVENTESKLISRVDSSSSCATTSSSASEVKTEEGNDGGGNKKEDAFRFLDLPTELRLKIYHLLLPPRTYKIVTQIPHTGFFYNTSTTLPPLHSTQSFYPYGRHPPPKVLLTTYKVLTTNSHHNHPFPSLHPEILRVSRKVKEEAEWVLYGGRGVCWDFGNYVEAVMPFFGDRSPSARQAVRNLRVGREIPGLVRGGWEVPDKNWDRFGAFLKNELTGLRNLDLTIWSSGGGGDLFRRLGGGMDTGQDGVREMELELELERGLQRRWREWEWTAKLLELEALKEVRVTWWGFDRVGQSEGNMGGLAGGMGGAGIKRGFDSWLAGRMVNDRVIRKRILGEGGVEEGVVVIPGRGALVVE